MKLVPIALLLCILQLSLHRTEGYKVVREYFIASNDIIWDYAPQGKNLANPEQQEHADVYLKSSSDRVGHKYKKSSYFQFTDATFTEEIPKSPVLGILGPIIHAEVLDRVEITFFNNASQTFSLHAHGLFYLKWSEGAVYLDGTSGKDRQEDFVLPGQTVQMVWNVTEADAPTDEDPNCLPWLYHSHVHTPMDTSTGVTGLIVTCKKGVLNSHNERTDVGKEYPIFVKNYDENMSWHADDSIDKFCLEPEQCHSLKDEEDEDFIESNYMRSINGYMYGHLPGLEACIGEKVAFYFIGFGNEFDVHSIHMHGQTLDYQHTRGDTVSVYSATFVAAEMVGREPGRWKVTDMVGTNEQAGISAFFVTEKCQNITTPPEIMSGNGRIYFLSADEIEWSYGQKDDGHDSEVPPEDGNRTSETHLKGKSYTKAVFREYTDETFTTQVARSEDETHMGVLGPALRVEVGDTLRVILRNAVRYPISLLAHGLTYKFEEKTTKDGSISSSGDRVNPSSIHTYEFRVPDDFLVGVSDSCLNFLYTSGHDPWKDRNSGLVGPVLICQAGYLTKAKKRRGQPKQFFLLLGTFDENESLYTSDNMETEDAEFKDPSVKFTINGYAHDNVPGLRMCQSEPVEWYVMSLGSEVDVHSISFDGNTFTERGKHRDGRQLVPGQTAALSMKARNVGIWEVSSHSTLARDSGMHAVYEVLDCFKNNTTADVAAPTPSTGGIVRTYFVAAEEVMWDYTPVKRSVLTGQDLTDPRVDGNIFIRNDESFIGSVYKKAVFRGYVDDSFSEKTAVDYENILGPTLKAEVGDVIRVTFYNNASRPYSLHSRGLVNSERGANYRQTAAVAPGQRRTYTWQVHPSSGPGSSDPNCIPWLYYSAVDPTKDGYSGLVGPLVLCRRGTLDKTGRRKDVDKELFVLMSVLNENLSWYLKDNIRDLAPARLGTDYQEDGDFEESNLMHAINGRLDGNNPEFVMKFGSKVAWYMMSLGAEVDLHSFHLHGHTFVHSSDHHREDVLQVFPGQAEVVEMFADNPGTWLLHCHVLDHINAGMQATYTVLEKALSDEPKATSTIDKIDTSEKDPEESPIVDKNEKVFDKEGWTPEVTVHILKLVEQLHTKLAGWDVRLGRLESQVSNFDLNQDAKFRGVEQRVADKISFLENRLEDKTDANMRRLREVLTRDNEGIAVGEICNNATEVEPKMEKVISSVSVNLHNQFSPELRNIENEVRKLSFLQSATHNQVSALRNANGVYETGLDYKLTACSKDMLAKPLQQSFPYLVIQPQPSDPANTPHLCDTHTQSGGWVVIHRRLSRSVNFYRNFKSYEDGFGSLFDNFWLGLKHIHTLTKEGVWELKVELGLEGTTAYAHYSTFSVGSEDEKYALNIGGYDGDAGDALSYHNGKPFSTFDTMHEENRKKRCAQRSHGAWWYNPTKNQPCFKSNLNGGWKRGKGKGISWSPMRNSSSIRFSEMKIRRTA